MMVDLLLKFGRWAFTVIGFLVVWVVVFSLFGTTEPGEPWDLARYVAVTWLVGFPLLGLYLLYRIRKRLTRSEERQKAEYPSHGAPDPSAGEASIRRSGPPT